MKDIDRDKLASLVLAPYIQKATALLGKRRRVGGNQFRHAMATMAILVDYHYTDAVLLKAALIHDLFEDVPETREGDIRAIDTDADQVVDLALEVTRREETRPQYFSRLRDQGTKQAKLLKVADRISNLTDLHATVFNSDYVERYVAETEEYVYPMALEVDANMANEIRDLMDRRRESVG